MNLLDEPLPDKALDTRKTPRRQNNSLPLFNNIFSFRIIEVLNRVVNKGNKERQTFASYVPSVRGNGGCTSETSQDIVTHISTRF